MDFMTRVEFELRLEIFFSEFDFPWEGGLSEKNRIEVCSAIVLLFKFIFEPRSIKRNRKYLQLIKADIFDIVIPKADNDLCEAVQDLWSFIKHKGIFEFLEQVSEWEDNSRYVELYQEIKRDIERLSTTKKKAPAFVYFEPDDNVFFVEFPRFSKS